MKVIDILPLASLVFALIPGVAQGQLIPDNSLGAESSVVTPHNPTTDHITGGATRGENLFHSFSDFNVDVGRSVYFANTPAIENILTRVTGRNQSNIFGTLGVLGNANLFLINPNGIVFGPSARLDISGSFFATTGDGIRLGRDGLFSATDLDPSSLLHVRPEALFGNALANHMARLNNQGNLAVGTGSALVLHGGEVRNSGSLTAPGGRVMVLGERIGLLDDALIDVSSPTGGGNVFIGGFLQGRGNIPTAGRTYIGPDVTISADAPLRGDGGNVIVWADRVTGFYGDISARGGLDGGDGGFVEVSGGEKLIFRGDVNTTAARGQAGTLLLDPRNIVIANGEPLMAVEDAESIAEDIFNGTYGVDVTLYESQLEGLSGETNVVLQATNDVTVEDLSDNSLNFASGTGDVTIIADADNDGVGDFSMADPADTINTNGRNIAITGASLILGNIDTSLPAPDGAGELLTTAAVVSTGSGEQLNSISGNLFGSEDVDLYQIYLTGEGTFSATTIDGSDADTQLFLFDRSGLGVYGNDDNREACNCAQSTLPAGDPLTPTAPGIYYLGINVFGVNPVSESGEIFAAATTSNLLESTGAGGALPLVGWENVSGNDSGDYTITLTGVEGPSATLAEVIDNTVIGDSGAITLTATNGNITAGNLNAASLSGAGGEIRIEAAADIVLNDEIDASGISGNGGEVSLRAGGNITLNPGSGILSSGQLGGKIDMVSAADISIVDSIINSTSNTAVSGTQGGDLTISANRLTLNGDVAVATSGAGNGGNIYIDATEVEVRGPLELGQSARGLGTAVVGEGNGGNLTIETERLTIDDGAWVSVSTLGAGDAGDLTVNATEVEVTGSSLLGSLALEGNGGDLTISTERLTISDGALVWTTTFGTGKGGDITVQASTDAAVVEVFGTSADGQNSQLSAYGGDGDGGNLTIETGSVRVRDGAQISTFSFGSGKAGDLMVRSSAVEVSGTSADGSSFSGLFTFGNGADGGNLTLESDRLTVSGGALVSSETIGSGNAGDLIVRSGEAVEVSGTSVDGQRESKISVETNAEATGDGGSVQIETQRLTVRDGGQISASTSGSGKGGSMHVRAREVELIGTTDEELPLDVLPSGLYSAVSAEDATGDGGSILVETDRLTMREGGRIDVSTFGEGNAGSLRVIAPTAVELIGIGTTPDGLLSSGFYSAVNSGNGEGGSVLVETDRLTVRDGAWISTSSFGSGKAGDITIIAPTAVELMGTAPHDFNNTGLFTLATIGDGGNVYIESDRLTVRDGAQINTSTLGSGKAGDITAIAATAVEVSGTSADGQSQSSLFTSVGPDATGDGGDVRIETERLSVRDGAQINASTFGEGKAGDITAIAATAVEVSGTSADEQFPSSMLTEVGLEATGDGGELRVETERLTVSDGALIDASTFSSGNAGNITITAKEEVMVIGQSPNGLWVSELGTAVGSLATGNGGNLRIETGRLAVLDGALINASTLGDARGGDITVTAREKVELIGRVNDVSSGLYALSAGRGEAGSLRINTEQLFVRARAGASVRSTGEVPAGNLEVTATNVFLDDGLLGAQTESGANGKIDLDIADSLSLQNNSLITATTDSGIGGELNIDVASEVALDSNSQIASEATATGTAGSLNITTDRLRVNGGSDVTVSSEEGIAGSLNMTASEIDLNNGTISAETAEGNQGNITIDAPTVVLQNNSGITTNATGTATGGNITIATSNLVARDDSDISANAIDGRGGNISITASGVFLDTESEITATSDRGVDGTVEIQTQVDPARGLISLAQTPIDASSLISKGCEEYRGSEFIITGRGGIPPHPFETLQGEVIWLDWRALTDENSSLGYSFPSETSSSSEVGTPEEGELPDDEIRQAQGWLQLPDGTVVLTAYPVKMTPVGPVMQHPGCQIIMGDRSR